MPFVSPTAQRELAQSITPFEVPEIAPDFGETFGAAVGQVFDEELSISHALNREGWADRRSQVARLIDDGKVDRNRYSDRRGRFDYDRLARDLNDPAIKTDEQLTLERNELLAKRREYAQDVLERGSGTAQFLGMATAYMLDPISIASLPLAAPARGAQSLGVIGTALLTARNTALVEATLETGIQAMVYEHKMDIDSPYSFADAIQNIAFAATVAGGIGGVTGGISGYLQKISKTAKTLDPDEITAEVQDALDSVDRMVETLKDTPELDFQKIEADFLNEVRAELLADSSNKLSRGDVKALNAELADLEARLKGVEEVAEPIQKEKGKPARKAKQEAIDAGKRIADEERAGISSRIENIRTQLAANERAKLAESELSRLEQGLLSERHERRLNEIRMEAEIENQAKHLETIERQRQAMDQPSKTPETYQEQPKAPAPTAKATARERDILKGLGIEKDFDADMDAFAKLDEAYAVIGDDELVDAKAFVKGIDEELDGLESVLVCSRG